MTGQVQGVGLRFQTWAKATELKLTGWVKNLSDGSVEIAAQGADADLTKFLSWLEQEFPNARIENLDDASKITTPNSPFEIRY